MTSERRRPVDRLARVTLRARGLLPEMGGPMGILLVLLLLETLLNSALPPNQVPQQLRASAHQLTQITSLPLSLAQTSASHPGKRAGLQLGHSRAKLETRGTRPNQTHSPLSANRTQTRQSSSRSVRSTDTRRAPS